MKTLGLSSAWRQRLRLPWRSLSFKVTIAAWALLCVVGVKRAPGFLFTWDSFGYYLYLPAAFIHNDPLVSDRSWVEQARTEHDASGTLYQLSTLPDGTHVIKYPMGLAILWSPWFAVGHVIAGVSGHSQDGYSPPYAWSVHAGMMVFLLVGLMALRSVLLTRWDERITAAVLLLLILCTNLLDQATAGTAMAHLPLFVLYAIMLRSVERWKSADSWRAATLFAACAGTAMLIRPSEAVCLLLPLLWPAYRVDGHLTTPFARRAGQWVLVLVIIGLLGSVQLAYWRAATGHWFVDTYNNAGEGFDLTRPHTVPFLFSFRKGWYIYTPLMLLATAGIIALRRAWPQAFMPVLAFFVVNLYVVSSWTCWWYADSFGSRAMVGGYAVMALPLAALLTWVRGLDRWWRWTTVAMLACILTLNLFQHWQYTRGIIHSSRMTWRAWRTALWDTEPSTEVERHLLVARSTTAEQGRPDLERYGNKWLPERFVTVPVSDRDTTWLDSTTGITMRAYRIDRDHPYTPALRIRYHILTSADHAWIEATWRVRPMRTPMRASFVHHFARDTANYAYNAQDVDNMTLIPDHWNTVKTWYLTPEVRSRSDDLVVYFWSRDTIEALVEGPSLTIHDPIDLP